MIPPPTPPAQVQPAVQTLADEVATTPEKPLAPAVTDLAEACAQLRPFQCSIRPPCSPAKSEVFEPTAHTSRAETMATEASRSPVWARGRGFALATRFQLWPFQCRVSVRSEPVPTK